MKTNSFSPPFIRVNTSTVKRRTKDYVYTFNRLAVAWKFTSYNNRRYWHEGYRKTDYPRGIEVQVDLDRDDANGSFGWPSWGAGPADDNGHDQGGVPNAWTASYRNAYPDDYWRDNIKGQYSVTVGMGSAPRSNRFRYRWAQVLRPLDDHDRVRPSVSPVHYAQDEHTLHGVSEKTYCNYRSTFGSCFFTDNIPSSKAPSYRVTRSGTETLRAPGQALFERK